MQAVPEPKTTFKTKPSVNCLSGAPRTLILGGRIDRVPEPAGQSVMTISELQSQKYGGRWLRKAPDIDHWHTCVHPTHPHMT